MAAAIKLCINSNNGYAYRLVSKCFQFWHHIVNRTILLCHLQVYLGIKVGNKPTRQ